ncbi:Cupin domain protein [Legionella santicrucis]|uniref:Cupin domain protein n=1 Tax=Legionella santicrucis TaxID=45074 RepID=A0A0W0Y9G8_9GAMM|nr:AraC family ligand binding domain-containing protein [Legionella santicrucis]KTD53456.1 Cupin domain protein [Legionella santicrucis]
MKISYANQINERKNSEVCVVTEYPQLDDELDFAIVNISGRYPDSNHAMNTKCKEMVYIQEGTGSVTVNHIKHILNPGDIVLIEAGETFFWEGNMTLFISCRPSFSVEQHVLI